MYKLAKIRRPTLNLAVMAEPQLSEDVLNVKSKDNAALKAHIYLEETFYTHTKNKFVIRITSQGLSIKGTDESSSELIIHLRDIIGSKCMKSKRRRDGARSSVCSTLVGHQQLKVVEENSGDFDETDISEYLYIYAYDLNRSRRSPSRERTTITLVFSTYDKYEYNNREAQNWQTTIKCLIAQQISYTIPTNDKKLLILLNPKSGSGKARELFQAEAASILLESETPYDLHITKNAQYAREYVRIRNVYAWRGIVAVGGDGLLFEILNGMFERLDWQQAFAEVPLAILPCGSGNGLARTICHHFEEPYISQNLTGLAIALTRGKTAYMDVVRVETESKIMFSFLSVGWGLLSDIDIESERLRAIGGQRFALWAVARLVGLRKYRGVVSYAKITDISNLPKSKHPITISHSVRQYHSATSRGSEMRSPVHACMHGPASRLPSLVSQLPSHWVHEEGEFVMVYVSYQSYIGENQLFAPRSQLSDGVMWMLIIKAGISKFRLLLILLSMNRGHHSEINNEYIKWFPVSAFRIVPEGEKGHLTVDGELVEYGPIQAEIFPNIVNLIVPNTK